MTKKNKLVCCGIISSLKQLKSSVILLRSPERCADLITSRHPKSQSPCLQLICQQMCQNTSSGCWSSRSVYQGKNLHCPLLFAPVEHRAVQRSKHGCHLLLQPCVHVLSVCDSVESTPGLWKLVAGTLVQANLSG